jgi:hypothetical protein
MSPLAFDLRPGKTQSHRRRTMGSAANERDQKLGCSLTLCREMWYQPRQPSGRLEVYEASGQEGRGSSSFGTDEIS